MLWLQLVSAAKIFDMIDSGDEHLDKYELYRMVRQVVLQKKDGETVSEHDTMVWMREFEAKMYLDFDCKR